VPIILYFNISLSEVPIKECTSDDKKKAESFWYVNLPNAESVLEGYESR
jgi:hypothetical protein